MGGRSKHRNFTEAYRELAVRRLRESDNVAELCRELGISRQLLYQWRDRVDRAAQQVEPAKVVERQLREKWRS